MNNHENISWPLLYKREYKKGDIRYRVSSESKIWRKVNTHENVWNALFGARGVESLFSDRSSQSGQNKRYGMPRFAIVWETYSDYAFITNGQKVALVDKKDAVELDVLGELASKNTNDGINLRKRLQGVFNSADQLRPFNEYEFETTDADLSDSANNCSDDVANTSRNDQSIVNPDGGQGRISDALKRKAIEDYAMVYAYLHYRREGYEVEDTSATKPYDLVCSKYDEEIRVEVKGTQLGTDAINLTKGEVDNAYTYDGRVDLFIMHDIRITASNVGDGYECLGGVAAIIVDWCPDAGDLVAMQYKYNVPNTQLQRLNIH